MSHDVLVIEDDPLVQEIIYSNLEFDGWRVQMASTGAEGRQLLAESLPDIVILDLQLPDVSGLDFCTELRRSAEPVAYLPILMLTALATQTDKLAGFESGADDYLTKPFDPRELNARLHALIARRDRPTGATSSRLSVSPFEMNTDAHTVQVLGRAIHLAQQEYELLRQFLLQPNHVLSREMLFKEVWNYSEVINSRTVDYHVSQLRKKISEVDSSASKMIKTVFGVGYKLECAE